MFSRWILCRGDSRGTRTRRRFSLRHTSAALNKRLLDSPLATEAILFMLAGTITMPLVGYVPLAMGARRSFIG